MFRAAALAIVMTLIASPVMGLVCKVVCASPVAAMPSCHRPETATTGVTGIHDCHGAPDAAPAVLRDAGRRSGSAQPLPTPGGVPATALVVMRSRGPAPNAGDTGPPLTRGPLTIVLRI